MEYIGTSGISTKVLNQGGYEIGGSITVTDYLLHSLSEFKVPNFFLHLKLPNILLSSLSVVAYTFKNCDTAGLGFFGVQNNSSFDHGARSVTVLLMQEIWYRLSLDSLPLVESDCNATRMSLHKPIHKYPKNLLSIKFCFNIISLFFRVLKGFNFSVF